MDIQLIETLKTSPRGAFQPQGICIHYTAGFRGPGKLGAKIQSWAGDIRKSSTDFVIGRAPKADRTCRMYRKHSRSTKMFADYTWHSGGSVWHGAVPVLGLPSPEKKTNMLLVGVDLDNYGFLQKIGGQWCFRRYGFNRPSDVNHKWEPGDRVFTGPVFVDDNGCGWEAYTQESIAELHRVVTYIKPHLHLPELTPGYPVAKAAIVGHENIRSTKSDPGRAFDQFWPGVRSLLVK